MQRETRIPDLAQRFRRGKSLVAGDLSGLEIARLRVGDTEVGLDLEGVGRSRLRVDLRDGLVVLSSEDLRSLRGVAEDGHFVPGFRRIGPCRRARDYKRQRAEHLCDRARRFMQCVVDHRIASKRFVTLLTGGVVPVQLRQTIRRTKPVHKRIKVHAELKIFHCRHAPICNVRHTWTAYAVSLNCASTHSLSCRTGSVFSTAGLQTK